MKLLEQINALSPTYTEDAVFPDIENISQKKIKKFMDGLLSVIPLHYIEEIPVLREVVPSQISSPPKMGINTKVPKPTKKRITHREQKNNQIEK